MLIIILVILGLSLLILGHEAGHFFVAKLFGLKVDEFGFGFPPRIFSWRSRNKKMIEGTLRETQGETEYSLNWLPFGGFVRISGERGELAIMDGSKDIAKNEDDKKRLFYAQPTWKKSLIVLAGVFINFILGWLLISVAFMIGTPQALIIVGIQPESPAATAGIMTNDVLRDFKDSQSFINFVNENRGKEISIAVLRGGREINIDVTPRVKTAENQGAIGVELQEGGAPREAPLMALWDGLLSAGILVWLTLIAFGALIKELFVHASLLPGVVGPVGIFGVAEETGKLGLTYLLQFMGIISINLTVVNLIPFPALDGGRFLMVIIEKIKGSPLSEKVEATINGFGFAFLLLLMVLLTVRDVKGLL